MSSLTIKPGTVKRTPKGGVMYDTVFTVPLSGAATTGTFYNGSVDFAPGDYLHTYVEYTGNKAHDITAQIDMF